MTPREFKAWFDGFTEAFTGVPTKAQWARIKERVAEIDGNPVTERVFIDRYSDLYWPQYPPRYWWNNSLGVGSAVCQATMGSTAGNNLSAAGAQYQNSLAATFNSTDAMNALGRADAQALAS